MSRFVDMNGDPIDGIISKELMPWRIRELGLDWTKGQYQLWTRFGFRSDILGGILDMEEGEVSDLASIPKPVHSIFLSPNDPRIAGGAWPHDKIYKLEGRLVLRCGKEVQITRRQADQLIAFEAMPELMASRWHQHATYQALQRGGRRWSNEHWTSRLKW